MISHPITYGEIPETVLFFDVLTARQEPQTMIAPLMGKLVPLGSLKALSIEPVTMDPGPMTTDEATHLLNQLYYKVATYPEEMYYVLMVGLVNLQVNRVKEAMEAIGYISEIFHKQPKMINHSRDNRIVFALTRHYCNLINLEDSPNYFEIWRSIKPTLRMRIELPPPIPCYIHSIDFVCGVLKINLTEVNTGSYLLPQDFSLVLTHGNTLRLQLRLEKTPHYHKVAAPLNDIHISIDYGFMRNNHFEENFMVSLTH